MIADPSSQWISFAIPLVLQRDLAAAPDLLASVAGNESAAYQQNATEILRTTVESRHDRIFLEADLTDAANQKNRWVMQMDGPVAGGLLPLANALAKRMDDQAIPFSTSDEPALRAFAGAAAATSSDSRLAALNEAIRLDAAFGEAYLALIDLSAQVSPQAVPAVLQTAAAHLSSFSALDRARLGALASRYSHAPLDRQETTVEAVLQIAPNSPDAIATLGALRFLQNDGARGERLFGRALELSPGSANIRQQLGTGLIEVRRFQEAEKVFTGLSNTPSILPALAAGILLQGDSQRAAAVVSRLVDSLGNPDLKTVFRSSWMAISGQIPQAIASLRSASFASPQFHSVALGNVAIWQMMGGDSAGAVKSAAEALHTSPSSFAQVASLIASGKGPANEWRARIDALGVDPQTRQTILGYGLFLNGHYAEAADVWRQILNQSGNTELRARAMLAASLDRAGHGSAAAASKIQVQPFVPEIGDLYAAISFGEMRRLLNLKVQ